MLAGRWQTPFGRLVVPEVKKIAHYTTNAHAGRGAIREAIELILKSKGIWGELIDQARA